MKMMRQLIAAACLALASQAMADNFTVADFSLQPGETKTLSVELNSTDNEYIAFEFYMSLPDGVSFLEETVDDESYVVAELNSARIEDHELTASRMNDGTYHFICMSLSNSSFLGTSGEILTLTVTASETASPATNLECKLFSQVLSDTGRELVEFDDFTFHVTIDGGSNGIMGDVNGDGAVTITDVTMTVGYVIGSRQTGFIKENADVNGDDDINITDVMEIVKIVISG